MTAKILLISTSKAESILIQNMLDGYKVLFSPYCLDAMGKIKDNTDLDLVLLDLNLPDKAAFEILAEIKRIKPYRKIRTVILTNSEQIEDEAKALQAGAGDYVRKPFSREGLRIRIAVQLEILRQQRQSKPELEERNFLFKTIFEQAPIGIVISRSEKPHAQVRDFISDVNPMYEKIIGRTQEEFNKLGWLQITHPDDLAEVFEKFRQLQEGTIDDYEIEKRFIRPDGSIIWANLTVVAIRLNSGARGSEHLYLVQDITKRKATEAALAESERSKSVLLSHLPGMAYRCKYDREWTMQFVSEGCYDLTGYRPECLLNNKNLSFNDLIAPEYREILWQQWNKKLPSKLPFRDEYEIITANGERKWVLEIGQGIYYGNGKVEALEGIIIDITKEKESLLQLKFVNEHDHLTGLYNRRFLQKLLEKDKTDKKNTKRALILLNLNKIDSINLTFGYALTESIVKELAQKLSLFVSRDRKLFRLSFKSFGFYVENYGGIKELRNFCDSLVQVLSAMQIMHIIGCGIGVAPGEQGDEDAVLILRNASIASEKAMGGDKIFDCCFVDAKLLAEISRETEIKDQLILIANDENNKYLYLQYQPVFDAKTNKIRGFEALARLKSEKLGKVAPDEFISLAEKMQLIVPIGLQIMRQACAFLKQLENEGYHDIKVSVNISAIQLFRNEFLEDWHKVINDAKVDVRNLLLELTESVFLNNYEDINKKLGHLRALGIGIAIDDFGVGYSSFAREDELNVDYLKLDKYFIDKLLSDEQGKSITGDIISMGHRLGHLVVAEGVEYEEQRQYLVAHNCDFLQGYLLSKPLDAEDAMTLFRKTNGHEQTTVTFS